ncbi:hypothetical protein [Wolinella succinogenes]|uniref:hypothetical protein n=1 Tax=Wolinella succinogenes TaxID=844 RepID=UPI002409E467|nr:hypothetical protein [Wolinella succinogenes]
MCKYIDELKKVNYTKSKISDIAKKYGLKESELKQYYQTRFFKNIAEVVDLGLLSKSTIEEIEKLLENETLINEFKFIKTDLKKIIEKSLYIGATCKFNPHQVANFSL